MKSEEPSLPDVRCIAWLDGLRAISFCAQAMKQKPATANQATGRRIVVGANLDEIVPSGPRKIPSVCKGVYSRVSPILSYDANLGCRNLRVYFYL